MSRRKKRPRPARSGAPEAAPAPGRSLAWGLGLVTVLVALGLAAFEWRRSRAPDPGPPESWAIPDVRGLAPPIERLLDQARERVGRSPDSAVAWGHLGSVFKAHGQHAEALVCYEHAEGLDPEDYRWPYLRASSLVDGGAGEERALAAFERAAELAPAVPAVGFFHGVELIRRGLYPEAVETLRRTLAVDPDMAVAHRVLGQALLSSGEPEAAIAALERAVGLNPEDKKGFASLAQAYRSTGRLSEAEEATLRSDAAAGDSSVADPAGFYVQELKRDPAGVTKRANQHIKAREWARAIDQWEYFLETNPESQHAWLALADCYLQLGEVPLARALLERSVQLDPAHVAARLQLAYLARQRGDLSEVHHHATGILELEAGHVEALCLRGFALAAAGHVEEGIADFVRAGSLVELPAAGEHDWGAALLLAGRPREAEERFEASLRAGGDNPRTLIGLGDAQRATGNLDGASQSYGRAVALQPDGEARGRLQSLQATGR